MPWCRPRTQNDNTSLPAESQIKLITDCIDLSICNVRKRKRYMTSSKTYFVIFPSGKKGNVSPIIDIHCTMTSQLYSSITLEKSS